MTRRRSSALAACALALLVASTALAYEALHAQLAARAGLSALFRPGHAYAQVQDGLLLGEGHEEVQRLPDGSLRLLRDKTYRQLRHPEHGRLVPLDPPWRVRSTLELSPALRLRRDHTTLALHPLADRELAERLHFLFDWNESRTEASARGDSLTRVLLRAGREVERERYDYPSDAIAIEILGVVLAAAVDRKVDRFDFDLLLPGGATHGVRCDVHRVTRIGRLARGYRVPTSAIEKRGPLAIAELRLASPFKRLFFPHHVYLAFSARDASTLLALWGGDPDENLQAFRVER